MLSNFEKNSLQLGLMAARQAEGRRNSERGEILSETNFVYTHPLLTVAALTTSRAEISISSDNDFDNYVIMGQATDAAGTTLTSPFATVQITDSNTGNTIFSAPALFASIVGTGSLPYILSAVRQFKARSLIQIDYTNLSANPINFQIGFGGLKLKYRNK